MSFAQELWITKAVHDATVKILKKLVDDPTTDTALVHRLTYVTIMALISEAGELMHLMEMNDRQRMHTSEMALYAGEIIHLNKTGKISDEHAVELTKKFADDLEKRLDRKFGKQP